MTRPLIFAPGGSYDYQTSSQVDAAIDLAISPAMAPVTASATLADALVAMSTPVMADFGVPAFGVSSSGGTQNCIIGEVTNSEPPATVAFPTGVTGYGKVTTAGNFAFGMFGRADLATEAVPGVAVNEFNSFNFAGEPTGDLPVVEQFGTTDFLTVAAQCVAYGDYRSTVGLGVLFGSQQFIYGIYVHPEAAQQWSMVLDADVTHGPTQGGALIRTMTGVPNLVLQTQGTFIGADNVLRIIDGAGAVHGTFTQQGDYYTSGIFIGFDGTINYISSGTAASANTGANGAPPAQVVGYLIQKVGGVNMKFPYYNV